MEEYFQEWSGKILPWVMSHGLRIVIVLAGAWILRKIVTRFIERLIRVAVTRDRHMSADAERKREDTLIRIFSWTITIIITLVSSMMILQELSVPIGPIIAGAGIVGLAVGFGGQYLIRDIISGFFIILENQYRIGDVVSIDQTSGAVEDISLRMTTLRDMNGTVHHIPHGDIKRVANQSKQFARINLDIRVAYSSDIDKVIHLINQTGQALADDPAWKSLINRPPQFLRVDDLTDAAVTLKITGETAPQKQWTVAGELRKRLKEAFDREGVLMPFSEHWVNVRGSGGKEGGQS